MSDPLAVRLRSEHATMTEQLQAAKLIDSLVAENEKMREVMEEAYGFLNSDANVSPRQRIENAKIPLASALDI